MEDDGRGLNYPAISANDALESCALIHWQQVGGHIVQAMAIVSSRFAELNVVAVHPRTWRQVFAGITDHGVVLEHRLAFFDHACSNLVPQRDVLQRSQ
ncbi:hypothetical protein D3C73_1232130 [compost metagenome]